MKFLGLTRGYYAVVDDEDYERLSQYKWHAAPRKRKVYAARCRRVAEGPGPQRRMLHYEVLNLPCPLGEGRQIDHVNGNPLDCRKRNLRTCTFSENGANRPALRKRQASKYKGVTYVKKHGYHKAGWVATIKFRGDRRYLGFFQDEQSAMKAYNVAAYRCFGKFAYLNRWEGPTGQTADSLWDIQEKQRVLGNKANMCRK